MCAEAIFVRKKRKENCDSVGETMEVKKMGNFGDLWKIYLRGGG